MQPERAWLEWVRRAAARGVARPEVRVGIGDDAAILRPRRGWELAITTDLFVEGVHFLRRRDAAASCGWRLAARAVSDLAAMGAEPLALFVSSAYPAALDPAWPRQLYRGLMAAAAAAGCGVAGGDVSAAAGDAILLDVVGAGQVPSGQALRRSGARPGDRLFVSGVLGEAARGRALAHAGLVPRTAADRRALARHRRPRARWELGLALRGRASAAMDVSDGLATDLHRLCAASRVGAELLADRVPALARPDGLALALAGGEDYELLFTLPPRRRPPPGTHEIGRILAVPGVCLVRGGRREPLAPAGWEHFA